jgi:hypothetical protein
MTIIDQSITHHINTLNGIYTSTHLPASTSPSILSPYPIAPLFPFLHNSLLNGDGAVNEFESMDGWMDGWMGARFVELGTELGTELEMWRGGGNGDNTLCVWLTREQRSGLLRGLLLLLLVITYSWFCPSSSSSW